MNDGAKLISEVIPHNDTSDFLWSIKNTLLEMPPDQVKELYFYVMRRNAVAISFDSRWQPFIGITKGYNYSEDRTYISGGGAFLALIKSKFRACPHEISGGRVFLRSDRAYHVTVTSEEEIFIRWIWLGNSLGLIDDVLEILLELSPNDQLSPLRKVNQRRAASSDFFPLR